MRTIIEFLLLALCVAMNGPTFVAGLKKVGTQFSNCNDNDPIQMKNIDFQPDPIVAPGTLTFSGSFSFAVDVVAPVQANFTVLKKNGESWDDFPCKDGIVGSCFFEDLCALDAIFFPPDLPCPDVFVEQNFPCHCPIAAGEYTITGAQLPLPQPFSLWESGDFKIHLEAWKDGVQYACWDYYISLA